VSQSQSPVGYLLAGQFVIIAACAMIACGVGLCGEQFVFSAGLVLANICAVRF
jgi:hypothetical protein